MNPFIFMISLIFLTFAIFLDIIVRQIATRVYQAEYTFSCRLCYEKLRASPAAGESRIAFWFLFPNNLRTRIHH